MLYPRINKARTVMDLAGLWEFKLGDANPPGDTCGRLTGGERIAVPPLIMIRRKIRLTKTTMAGPGMRETSRFLPFLRDRGCFCGLTQ